MTNRRTRDERLVEAERHVVGAEMNVTLQRAAIERMEAVGADLASAEDLLAEYERFLEVSLAHRQMILDEPA